MHKEHEITSSILVEYSKSPLATDRKHYRFSAKFYSVLGISKIEIAHPDQKFFLDKKVDAWVEELDNKLYAPQIINPSEVWSSFMAFRIWGIGVVDKIQRGQNMLIPPLNCFDELIQYEKFLNRTTHVRALQEERNI